MFLISIIINTKNTSVLVLFLITAQAEDMTGDYLALLMTEGYLELRLDCGTGPGRVRSATRVNIGQWNRLTVFRHDWGVWIQLNEGPKQKGRSQVPNKLKDFNIRNDLPHTGLVCGVQLSRMAQCVTN